MREFSLVRARSAQEAVQALAAHPEARLMAGGTTLHDLMKLGAERPPAIAAVRRRVTAFMTPRHRLDEPIALTVNLASGYSRLFLKE